MGYTYVYTQTSTGYSYAYYLTSPSTLRVQAIREDIENYSTQYNPFSTLSSKAFSVKSISGKSKTITLTLKSKVTDTQIYGANFVYSDDTDVRRSSTYSFPIVVQRLSNGYKYHATATIKSGSAKMTIKLTNGKLVKGQKYKLLAQTETRMTYNTLGNWLNDGTNKNTFTAK